MINGILVEVKEIEQDDIPYLCFIYQDKSEENYEIFDDKGRNECYIEKPGRQKHYLIEKNPSIESRRESEDFHYCIFLIQIDFESAIFKRANFGGATFTKQANFEDATFTTQANFQSATFIEDADFWSAKFTEQASFNGAKFTEQANFGDTIFTEQANFRGATFTEQVGFGNTTFTEQADFRGATFTEQANFRYAIFSQHLIDFEQAQFLTSLNLNGVKSITLNLYQSQLDKIYYDTDCKFSVDNNHERFLTGNRETFLILKSIALKQNDKIKALEFHTQEYEQHLKDICPQVITDILAYCAKKLKKILAYCAKKLPFKLPFKSENWIILGFEKVVSNFGTSVIRSVLWYFGFAVLFYLFMNGFNIDTKTIINFIIPINIAVGDFLINCDSDTDTACVNWYHYILFAFYKLGQIVLLYEIIKSFRKYSRSL